MRIRTFDITELFRGVVEDKPETLRERDEPSPLLRLYTLRHTFCALKNLQTPDLRGAEDGPSARVFFLSISTACISAASNLPPFAS